MPSTKFLIRFCMSFICASLEALTSTSNIKVPIIINQSRQITRCRTEFLLSHGFHLLSLISHSLPLSRSVSFFLLTFYYPSSRVVRGSHGTLVRISTHPNCLRELTRAARILLTTLFDETFSKVEHVLLVHFLLLVGSRMVRSDNREVTEGEGSNGDTGR